MQLTEHQIQQLIINYLQAKRYYVQRLNAGQYSVGEGRNKRYIMGVAKGTPDIMAFKSIPSHAEDDTIKLLFVEVKRPGEKPKPIQEMRMRELEEYGARCIIAHGIEDLEALGI